MVDACLLVFLVGVVGIVVTVAGAVLFCWSPALRTMSRVVVVDGDNCIVEADSPRSGEGPYRVPAAPGLRVPLLRVRRRGPRFFQTLLGLALTLIGIALLGFSAACVNGFVHRSVQQVQGSIAPGH